LIFAHFLYGNGRAVRFLAKSSLFKIPVVGRILRSAEQLPVDRTSSDPEQRRAALEYGVEFLRAGHCLGFYPEGTITRDPNYWPMVAKTGLARIAVISRATVIPCVQWGAQEILPAYSKVPRLWRRHRVVVWAGQALDFSPWFGLEDDHAAMVSATEYAMGVLTRMLEEIRGECAPAQPFDPHASDLPRTGNFKGRQKKGNS
jgi:1-acyl-sn-glycerol-3-phosphate acyltransferase